MPSTSLLHSLALKAWMPGTRVYPWAGRRPDPRAGHDGISPRLRARLRPRGLGLQFGQERHEAIALHDDMRAQTLAGFNAVSREKRLHHPAVLVKGRRKPPAHAQLQAPVRLQLALEIARAQSERTIVRGVVDRGVKICIGVIVGVDVALLAGLAATLEGGDQRLALFRRHAACGEARAGGLELAHEFERLQK